jgi:Flp pilus assembly protein TadD
MLNRSHRPTGLAWAIVMALCAVPAAAQSSGRSQDPNAAQLRQASQQMREGHEDQAVALVRDVVAKSPNSYQAQVTLGNMLDFAGKYDEARAAFLKASALAPAAENRNRALRAIAISYGFQADCPNVVKHAQPVYEQYLTAKDFYNAGEVANELARLCFDAGSLDVAEQWYRKGEAAGLQEPDIKAERSDLWHYRLEHALARIAAKRGDKAQADRHVATAKEILDRGNMPAQQKEYFPYLTGFVALYTGDAQGAITDLIQGNQNDAYVLGLLAQAYEKLGQKDKALEYYRKVLTSTTHNPTTAAARPLAKRKVAEFGGAH